MSKLADAELTGRIINAFYAVYDELGYGFLESTYCNAFAYELTQRGLSVAREVPIEVFYKTVRVGYYRADQIIEGRVVVEAKATRSLEHADWRQLLNVLRGTRLEVGLLLHFGPKASFKRLVFENRRKRALPNAGNGGNSTAAD